ncbi:MAG: site-specific tyrosine recombinase XerC [bacterium ADurb.Bin157]|nr:MAG: site-specific tyrosine recombinase XerC [bacterium ADurb.Bin157]
MNEIQNKRKKRSDKFPLTLHPTGQFCKKVRGKLYYFGSDKKIALQRYLEQAAYLHSGNTPILGRNNKDISIRYLCNVYLENQTMRATIGQIKARHVCDLTILLRDFVRFIGPSTAISAISTMDLQNYINKQIKAEKSANTINNRIAAVKAMLNWALNNEIINSCPNLKAIKKITKVKHNKFIFNMQQIQTLLENADVQMKAMILLGLNCGFGCTDCGELKWENLDLENCRVIYPRGKTGIPRNFTLWPETISALKNVTKKGGFVFYTLEGNPWVRVINVTDKFGTEKFIKEDAVTTQFSILLNKTGIKPEEKSVGFYTLRRTAATMAAKSGDPFAVQKLLGHADLKMATTYVQDVSEQTDRVVNNMRKLIIADAS